MFELPTKYTIYINKVNKKNSIMITDDFDDEDAKYIFNFSKCDKIIVTENDKVVKEITRKKFELYETRKLCKNIDSEFKKCPIRTYANLESYCNNNHISVGDYLKNLGYQNYFEYKDDLRYLPRKELPINEILDKIPKTIKEYVDYPIDLIKEESQKNQSPCDSQDDLVYADNDVCYYDCHDGDYIFIDTQEAMEFKETDCSYLKDKVLYVNALSDNLIQVDHDKNLYNEICIKYNLYDCIKENCYIDEYLKQDIKDIKKIDKYKFLSKCKDFSILKEKLSEDTLKKLEKGIASYEYYQSKYYDDGDIIEEYQGKYGNADLINWYEGLIETDELIKSLNCGVENEMGYKDEKTDSFIEKEGELENEL